MSTNSKPPVIIPAQQSMGQTISGKFSTAAAITAKQLELTKLTTLTLPGLYKQLGTQLYKPGTHKEQHSQLFQELDQLAEQHKELKTAKPSGEGFAAKSKAVMNATKDMAHAKIVETRITAALQKLGIAGHEAAKSIPELLPNCGLIDSCVAKIESLKTEIAGNKKSFDGTGWYSQNKRVVNYVAGGLAALMFLFILYNAFSFSTPAEQADHRLQTQTSARNISTNGLYFSQLRSNSSIENKDALITQPIADGNWRNEAYALALSKACIMRNEQALEEPSVAEAIRKAKAIANKQGENIEGFIDNLKSDKGVPTYDFSWPLELTSDTTKNACYEIVKEMRARRKPIFSSEYVLKTTTSKKGKQYNSSDAINAKTYMLNLCILNRGWGSLFDLYVVIDLVEDENNNWPWAHNDSVMKSYKFDNETVSAYYAWKKTIQE